MELKNNNLSISDQVVEYILTRNIDELGTLSQEKIADILGKDPTYLEGEFKRSQKISIPGFILREKMHRTVFLLEKQEDINFQELSRKLGFITVDHFVREFKNYLAIDPHKYKELKRSNT
jgi:AraC-like DNA-binding protein